MKAHITIFFFFLSLTTLFAQGGYSRKNREIFPEANQYEQKGWLFGAGVTYMLPPFIHLKKKEVSVYDYSSSGKLGITAEVGRFHLLEYSTLFKFFDYELSYKMLKGKEKYSKTDGTLEGENSFSSHYLSLNFNLNNVTSISDYNFIMNTIGVNADYLFAKTLKQSSPVATETAESFMGQLHYKLGYGIKASDNLIVIVNLETPLLNMYVFEKGKSTLGFFNSRYRPLLLKLTFLLFKPRGYDVCPPVYSPGMPEEIQQNGGY